jgi:hypothetical protein
VLVVLLSVSNVPINVKSVVLLPIFDLLAFPTCKVLPEIIVPIPTLPLHVLIPDTFNDDIHVVELFNVVFPDIFNVDMNVEGLLKLINARGFYIAL